MRESAKYDRIKAVSYAEQWALSRNPRFGDFSELGGDCANFASQCLYAGWGSMTADWYYRSMRDRTPSWSGTRFLREYLLGAERAELCGVWDAEPGDLIVLWNGQFYYHSLFVLKPGENPLVAAHTHDVINRPLDSYYPLGREALHIL